MRRARGREAEIRCDEPGGPRPGAGDPGQKPEAGSREPEAGEPETRNPGPKPGAQAGAAGAGPDNRGESRTRRRRSIRGGPWTRMDGWSYRRGAGIPDLELTARIANNRPGTETRTSAREPQTRRRADTPPRRKPRHPTAPPTRPTNPAQPHPPRPDILSQPRRLAPPLGLTRPTSPSHHPTLSPRANPTPLTPTPPTPTPNRPPRLRPTKLDAPHPPRPTRPDPPTSPFAPPHAPRPPRPPPAPRSPRVPTP